MTEQTDELCRHCAGTFGISAHPDNVIASPNLVHVVDCK
jgi:hypothetical protein